MKRFGLLAILFILANSGALAQDEMQYRMVDTTLVFSESDFNVVSHGRTGNQSIGRANQEDTEWNRPKEEMASVPWRVLKIFVARDESVVDINCEAEDETLYIENFNLRQQNGDSLNEDFPKNRVYDEGFNRDVNEERTGFECYYLFFISPFRYNSQEGNFYLYKKIHMKMRFMKNPSTIVKVCGTVKNQDDQPLPGASLTFAGTEYDINEDGTYQMLLSVPTYTDGWREAVSGTLEVKAEGYTSFSRKNASFEQQWDDSDWCLDFILYNQLHFQAGKRYTLILPVEPDASLGRYFRLDRVEGNKIIFERESSPKANIPYVFYPDNDLTINLEGMDLTQEPECTIVNDNPEDYSSGKDPRVFFEGFYVTGGECKYWFASNKIRIEEDEYYQSRNGYYGSDAMHATLYFQWDLFSTAPELIFHDPETVYRPFVEEGKVWKVGYFGTYSPEIGGYTDAHSIEYFYFDGDTIVGGQRCKKMMCREECDVNWHSYHEPQTSYVGAIYENNQRVYCALPNSNDFVLLYDFATDPETEIEYYNTLEKESTKGLIARRKVCEDGLYHGKVTEINLFNKTYIDRPETNIYWREGVGYNGFYNSWYTSLIGSRKKLMQCTLGDEILYNDPSLKDCVTPQDSEVKKNWLDFTHTVKTRPKGPRRVKAESDEETVTGEYSVKELFVNFKTLTGPYTITVLDAAGQPIYNKEVQTSNVVALNTDISTYPKGSYTITVENEEEAYSAEFTISDEDGLTPQPPLLQEVERLAECTTSMDSD